MNIGLVISFYDEHEYVFETIKNFKNVFNNFCVSLVHTNDNKQSKFLDELKKAHYYECLEDLSKIYEKDSYQAKSISRNFSVGFSNLYKSNNVFDLICALTGDTYISDPSFLIRLKTKLENLNKVAAISQAIGQNFHKSIDEKTCVKEGRYQHDEISDFMPQLFVIDGKFANKTKCFSDIKVTNTWTSEQCLGDELKIKLDIVGKNNFHDNILRLNEENKHYAYCFDDGVIYHAKTNGIPGR